MEYSGQSAQILYVISVQFILYFSCSLRLKSSYTLFYPVIISTVLSLAPFVPHLLLNNCLFILSSSDLLGLPAETVIS